MLRQQAAVDWTAPLDPDPTGAAALELVVRRGTQLTRGVAWQDEYPLGAGWLHSP